MSLFGLHHCLQIIEEFELYSALETGGLVLVNLIVVWDTRGLGQADVCCGNTWGLS